MEKLLKSGGRTKRKSWEEIMLKKARAGQVMYSIWLIMIGLGMFVWNYKTPYMNEDLDLALPKSISAILDQGSWDYFNWNGRFLGQTFSRLLIYGGRFWGSLTAAFFFVALIVMLAKLTRISTTSSFFLFEIVLLTAVLFLFTPDFGSVYIWRAGVGNYLIMMVIYLCFLDLFINDNKPRRLTVVLIMVVGFISGWGNENTSGGIILVCIAVILVNYFNNRKFYLSQVLGLFSAVIGFVGLILSPGDKRRLLITHPNFLKENIVKRTGSGFLQILSYLYGHPINVILVSLVFISLVSSFYYLNHTRNFELALIFALAGTISILVMALSPEGQGAGRTYFGPFVFFVIALFYLIPSKLNTRAVRAIIISVGGIVMLCALITVGNGLQQARVFNAQLNSRYQYIINQKKKGKRVIKVAPLHVPDSRYSLTGSYIELGNNPEAFPNGAYQRYFDVDIKVKE